MRLTMKATTGSLGAIFMAAAATVAIAAPPAAKSSGDAVAGSKTFAARCAMCNGKAGVGTAMAPNLHGAFGAKAGQANDPRNSAALNASNLTCTAAHHDTIAPPNTNTIPDHTHTLPHTTT